MKYLNTNKSSETSRKSSSAPADIFLFKVNNGSTKSIRKFCSKFRGVFRAQSKILAFVCHFPIKAPLQIFDRVLIPTLLKLTMKTPEQRHSRRSCNFAFDFEHIQPIGFYAYFTYFRHISQLYILTVFNKKTPSGKIFEIQKK